MPANRKSHALSLKPSDIFTEVEALPPLMRERAAKAYIGKEIDWVLVFENGSEDERGHAHLVFSFRPHSVRMVMGEVPLEEHPDLRSMLSGTAVHVCGRIRKVDALTIELEIRELVSPKVAEVAHGPLRQ